MKSDAFFASRRSRRNAAAIQPPSMIESLETRSLLSGDPLTILSPVGRISNAQPVVSWAPIPMAQSYDLWISDVEARERTVYREAIPGNSLQLSGGERLYQGQNRIWVRARLNDGSVTDWGPPGIVTLQAVPVVVGPSSSANPGMIDGSDWAVTWRNPSGAVSYEVFVSNQTEQTSATYFVQNDAPLRDARGNIILDGMGNPIGQDVRSLFLNGSQQVIGAAPIAVRSADNLSWIDITSRYHGLANGDQVRVTGVRGNTAANGTFTVTVISPHVFRLNEATSNGAYEGGGRWIRYAADAPAPGAAFRPVSGLTTSHAIQLTLGARHGLKTGDSVRISGVEGNTAANGTFTVTVIAVNRIQLTGVAGSNPYLQGGTLTQLTEQRSNLAIGSYRIFVRSTNDAGQVSVWSQPFNFEITPSVSIHRPFGSAAQPIPTFEQQPLLQWHAVPGATHYQVEVYRAGTSTPLYSSPYLVATNFRIPENLNSAGAHTYEFRVRARRLHQVSTISFSELPLSGSFSLTLTTTGASRASYQTAVLPFSATATEIRNVVAAIPGFQGVNVIQEGTGANTRFQLQIPLHGNAGNPMVIGGSPVTVTVNSNVTPGHVIVSSLVSAPVDGLWSSSSFFTMLRNPQITGPIGVETSDPSLPAVLITDLRPTVTWTPVDRAARYEIWVELFSATSTYLRTTSTTNSYKFAQNLAEGRYSVRVRAISTTGEFTGWSADYLFTATGGRPIINSVSITPERRAVIEWTPVAEARSWELQIEWVGVNFNFLNPGDIRTTSFTTTQPLSAGTYRVWVRAILANGRALTWSTPVRFEVTATDRSDADPAEQPLLAANLIAPVLNGEYRSAESDRSSESVLTGPQNDGTAVETTSYADLRESVAGERTNISDIRPAVYEQLIEELAETIVDREWWNSDHA